MSLNALDVVLDLSFDANLADSHVKEIFKKCLKFLILREGAVNAVFTLVGHLLTTLGNHYSI